MEMLDDYVGKENDMFVEYSSLEGMLNETTMVKKLFDTVPHKYYKVLVNIEQFYDLNTMPFEEVVGCLKKFEKHTSVCTY